MLKQNQIIAGIDEAGRGPLFGPVVACCVLFNEDIDVSEIKDSKKISPIKRKKIYDRLIQENIDYGIGVIHEKKIDEINILNATKEAMVLAVNNLKSRPDKLLIDGNQLIKLDISQEAIIKGDQKIPEISAASIIAKVVRDKIVENYSKVYPMFELLKHKGYGTRLHIDLLYKYGPSVIHRQTFKPISNMSKFIELKHYESQTVIRYAIQLIRKGTNLKEISIGKVVSFIKYFELGEIIYVLSVDRAKKESIVLNFIAMIKEKDSVKKARLDVIYLDDNSDNPKIKYSCKIS